MHREISKGKVKLCVLSFYNCIQEEEKIFQAVWKKLFWFTIYDDCVSKSMWLKSQSPNQFSKLPQGNSSSILKMHHIEEIHRDFYHHCLMIIGIGDWISNVWNLRLAEENPTVKESSHISFPPFHLINE